jgi:DNA polymerase-1
MKRDYPTALSLVEAAARAGERGESVRSVLGRTSPRADPSWSAELGDAALGRERARGRFTRNFIIQASAADWANVLLSSLRGSLTSVADAELVFFVHDEVVVHVPRPGADDVVEAIRAAGAEATRLVFGETPVAMPLAVATVESYAEAK